MGLLWQDLKLVLTCALEDLSSLEDPKGSPEGGWGAWFAVDATDELDDPIPEDDDWCGHGACCDCCC